MSEAKQRRNAEGAISRRQVLQGGLAAGFLAVTPFRACETNGRSTDGVQTNTLFPTGLPHGEWVDFEAEGFSAPVVGVIHRREYPALCGVPLGGIGTGCLDLDTSGLFGLCSIFNSHSPRRGAMNWPFLGFHINGQTWVVTTGQRSPERGSGHAANEPRPPDLVLPGVKMAKNIHYWGHYPVADMEFEADAPVSLGVRAWSPLIPGDAALSNTPGAMFELHLRNKTEAVQSGTLAFSFFGPSYDEGWTWKFKKEQIESPVRGIHVTSRLSSYVLGVVGKRAVRIGGAMGESPEVRFRPEPDHAKWAKAWANLGESLPPTFETESGASVATDFLLNPGAEDTILFVLAWYSPRWMSSGSPTNGPRSFRHMYSTRHDSALSVAKLLVDRHAELLSRILAWQQEIYREETLPKWLREVLLNMLHTYAEGGFWAAAETPIGEWCRQEDGLFAICESPRTCAQMECLPVTFFGTLPLVYFFPQLALSTLRGEKAYQFENGAPAMIMGGACSWSGGPELASPDIGYQVALNPTAYVSIVDRFRMLHGDESFVRAFYPSVKRAVEYMVGLNRGPDGTVSMPDRLESVWPGVPYETEWLEWGRWAGIVPHVGGLHIATLAMAERMAGEIGDHRFAQQCREWFEAGSTTLENKTWLGSYYLRYFDPETGERSEDVAACQLDGQLVARMHGLRDVFRVDRVPIALETIKHTCVDATKLGTVLYASPTGTATEGGASMMFSYPATETFMQVIIPLGLMYIYAGQRELGLEIMRRAFHNCICRQGFSWYGENSFDAVTGKHRSGCEYVVRMFLWGTIVALQNSDLSAITQRGGLVERILEASQATNQIRMKS